MAVITPSPSTGGDGGPGGVVGDGVGDCGVLNATVETRTKPSVSFLVPAIARRAPALRSPHEPPLYWVAVETFSAYAPTKNWSSGQAPVPIAVIVTSVCTGTAGGFVEDGGGVGGFGAGVGEGVGVGDGGVDVAANDNCVT